MHLAWLLISATAAAPPATIGTCTNDQDCVIYSKQYPSSRSGYACVQNTCKTLLIPGARCISSDACSLHHFLLKQFNSTAPDVCEPRFCSLSTLCVNDGAADSDSVSGCCGGALQNEVCQIVAVDVCSQGSSCSPNDDNTFRCKIETKQSTQWIGVLITLVAAAVSNLGLNLQKLALRKRFEKRVVRDRNDHDTLQKRLAEMKSEFANMYHNASFVSLTMPFQRQRSQSPENPEAQNAQKKDEEEQMNSRDSNDSVIEPQPKQSPSFRRDRTQITQNTDITQASNTESRLSPPHQPMSPEFQTELHMAGLFKNPRWMLGFIVFFLGNILNVVALQFAAQSLVAPLGSISLVVNVLLAPWINKEMWGYHDIIGIILIVGGSAMVVAFAGSSQHDYCLSVLLVLFKKLETIIFLSILSALILGVFLFIIIVEKNLDMAKPDRDDAVIAALNDDIRLDNIQPSAETVDDITISMNADEIINSTGHNRRLTITAPNDAPDAASDSSSVRSMQFVYNLEPKKFNNPRIQEWYVSVQNAIQFVKEIKVIPRLKKKIKLADYRVRYLLPLSYASLGGLMATVTVLFAKATVNLLSISIFQGNNQYSHFDAWLITGITVVTACLQIYWINMGLARYDALLQIPVFYVVWTLFDVIGGGVYYGEFEGFTPLRFFLFGLGVAVIFGGVVVLSSRLKQLNDEEQNLVKAAVVAT